MSTGLRVLTAISIAITALAFSPSPIAASNTCEDGLQHSGAHYRICMPENWNGDLVIFAHGYVAFNEPVAIPEDQLELPNGISVPEIVNGLGYAFATTSYRANGLVVLDGIEDLLELVKIFTAAQSTPETTYLVGASEGGVITALSVERYPEVFDGGLAACGPIGDFRRQIDYWGDFRVIFDYFFPSVVPGSPVHIPDSVISNWEAIYLPEIKEAIAADRSATAQLLRVTRAPTDFFDRRSIEETVLGLMWYNVFATNDGTAQLGGQPFDNHRRKYTGSWNDLQLNRGVERFLADTAALEELAKYQTTGKLEAPLVTLHTTGDPIIPYWHAPLYRKKTYQNGTTQWHFNIPVFRYGHCNFNVVEVLVGFGVLVFKTTSQTLTGIENVLPDRMQQMEFYKLWDRTIN